MELEKQNGFERSHRNRLVTNGNPTFEENPEGEPDDEDTRPLDLRPEFCNYRDEGCDLAEACLDCPFDKCKYDEPGGRQGRAKKLRDREIACLHANEGKTAKELAGQFGISERTVQRVLKGAREHK